MDGVREVLLDTVLPSYSRRVLLEISDYIASKPGHAIDFRALLANPFVTGTDGISIDKADRPFAIMAAKALRRFGGNYIFLADRIEKVTSGVSDQAQPGSPSVGTSIGSLHKEVGQAKIQEKVVAFSQQEVAYASITYGSIEKGTSREQINLHHCLNLQVHQKKRCLLTKQVLKNWQIS